MLRLHYAWSMLINTSFHSIQSSLNLKFTLTYIYVISPSVVTGFNSVSSFSRSMTANLRLYRKYYNNKPFGSSFRHIPSVITGDDDLSCRTQNINSRNSHLKKELINYYNKVRTRELKLKTTKYERITPLFDEEIDEYMAIAGILHLWRLAI